MFLKFIECTKNDLSENDIGEEIFYDEVISDINGELFNCKYNFANCICRPNNTLIALFFGFLIFLVVLILIRRVFNMMPLSDHNNAYINSIMLRFLV